MAEEKKKQPETAARPLILEVDEAKKELFDAFNDIMRRHRVPGYFMELIVADMHRQITVLAQSEVAQLKANEQAESLYKNQLTKTEKKED